MEETAGRAREILGSKKCFAIAMILVFALSFWVRLWWTLSVQLPGEAIYSDMVGYIDRAQDLVRGEQVRDPYLAVVAYGAHHYYFILMKVFGAESYIAISIVNAVLSALTVVIVMASAKLCFRSVWLPYVTGFLCATWYPAIVYTGYFSTELPYSFFMCFSILLWFWYLRTRRPTLVAVAAGVVCGMGFAIRPQFMMTIIMFVVWAIVRRAHFERFRWTALAAFAVPIVMVAGFSMYRYHYFTGRHALISGNGPVNRLFASSRYRRIVCDMDQHDGTRRERRFQPPSARNLGYTEVFEFEGYIGDAEILNAERKRYWSELSVKDKLGLLCRNVLLLAYWNTMWPERNHAKEGWRKTIFEFWPGLVQYYVFPMAFVGFIILLFRLNVYLEIYALHYITMLYTALMYIGEIRYRVPYDFVLIVLAVYAVAVMCGFEQRGKSQDVFAVLRRVLRPVSKVLTS